MGPGSRCKQSNASHAGQACTHLFLMARGSGRDRVHTGHYWSCSFLEEGAAVVSCQHEMSHGRGCRCGIMSATRMCLGRSSAQPKSGRIRLARCIFGGAQPLPYPAALVGRSAVATPWWWQSPQAWRSRRQACWQRRGVALPCPDALLKAASRSVHSGPVVMGWALHVEHTYVVHHVGAPCWHHGGSLQQHQTWTRRKKKLHCACACAMQGLMSCLRTHPQSTGPPEAL